MLQISPAKTKFHLSVLLSIFVASAVQTATAETIYVNNIGGDDTNNGLTQENKGDGVGPLRTLTGALKRVERGDSIELAKTDVPYNECVTLQGRRHSGTSFAPFVIDGNGATLEGIAQVPAHRWEHVCGDIFRFAPDRAAFQQLFLDGEAAELVGRFDGFYNTQFLTPKQWCRCKGGIHFAAEKGKSVHNYELSFASHPVGITLYNVENVVIRNLKLRGFQLDGINAHDNAFDCLLSDISSVENGRSGVSVGGSSRVRLNHCELGKNNDTQLNAEGWSTSTLQDTRLVSKVAPLWKRELNSFGRGARVIIDGKPQVEQQGWYSEEQEEEKKLEKDLDALEQETEQTDLPEDESEGNQDADAAETAPAETNDLNAIFGDLGDEADDAGDANNVPVNEENEEPNDADPFAEESNDAESDATATEEDGNLFEDLGDGDLFEDTDPSVEEDEPFGDI